MHGHNLHDLNLKMVVLRQKLWHTLGHWYPIELKFHNMDLCHEVQVAYESLPLFMIICHTIQLKNIPAETVLH
jgi:hypothetical protein